MRIVFALLLCLGPLAFADDLHVVYSKDSDKDPGGEIPAKLWIKGDKLLLETWSGGRKLVRLDLGYEIILGKDGAIREAQRLKKRDPGVGTPYQAVKGEAARVAGLECTRFSISERGKAEPIFELWTHKGAGTTWSRYVGYDLPPTKGIEAAAGVWLKMRSNRGRGWITITASKVERAPLADKLFAIPAPDGLSEAKALERWASLLDNKNRLRRLGLALILYRDGVGKTIKYPPLKSLLSTLYTSGMIRQVGLLACARSGKAPTEADIKANRVETFGFVATPYPMRTNKGASETPWAWDRGPGGVRAVLFADGHVETMPEARFQKVLAAAKQRDADNKALGLEPMHMPD